MRILLNNLIAIFLASCAYSPKQSVPSKITTGAILYKLEQRDSSFELKRIVKSIGRKIVTKTEIYPIDRPDLTLEKTISVSELGTIKVKNDKKLSIRPEISNHMIWLEKYKYQTQSKINKATRKFEVVTDAPDDNLKGKRELSFPNGQVFCYLSQVPECVKALGFLNLTTNNQKHLFIIWDGYPFHSEEYEDVNTEAFQSAMWQLEILSSGKKHYSLNLGNQVIIYNFNDSDAELESMYWVAQGITLKRQ